MNEHITSIFSRDPDLRASDADREAIGERLRKSHAEGRLDVQEFQERLDRCLQAKTVGELEQLVSDLPRERPKERPFRLQRLAMVPLLVVLFGAIVIAAAVWHHGAPGLWALFPLFFLARFLLWPYRRWHRRGFMRIDDEPPRL
jgi:ferric-dicitrate binding protein FerR (iron transport regulator)